jgi:rod shape-determining protein MreC
LKYVARDADIKAGDRVISSGLGGVFPKGLLIGTVTSVTPPAVGISPYVEVQPAVNFDTLDEVMVIIQKGASSP